MTSMYKKGDRVWVTGEGDSSPSRNGPGTVVQIVGDVAEIQIDQGDCMFAFDREMQPLVEGEKVAEKKEVHVYQVGDRVLVKENDGSDPHRNGPATVKELIIESSQWPPCYRGGYKVQIDNGAYMTVYGSEMQPLNHEGENKMSETCLNKLVDELASQHFNIDELHARIEAARNSGLGHSWYTSVRFDDIKSALLAAYHRGLENAPLLGPKEEPLAKKYLLDFSQAKEWPEDMLKENDLLLDASLSGEFDVENYEEDALVPHSYKLSIEGLDLVLSGAGDVYRNGSCVVKVPREREDGRSTRRNYTITIEPDSNYENKFRLLRTKLAEYGVKFTPMGDDE